MLLPVEQVAIKVLAFHPLLMFLDPDWVILPAVDLFDILFQLFFQLLLGVIVVVKVFNWVREEEA
jgi:hypothetical protein